MMNKLSVRERREQFTFLTALFLFSTTLLGYGIFHDPGRLGRISRSDLMNELALEAEFERTVADQQPAIDTAYKQINVFNPGVQAIFLENDIKNTLDAVRSSYDRRAYDPRYKTFLQVSKLYSYLFINRRELKGNYLDLNILNKSLQDCKISRRDIKSAFGAH